MTATTPPMTATKNNVYKLLPYQTKFVQQTFPRFIGIVGGFRTGKTVAICHKAINMALLNPGLDGALLEPTYGMIKRTLIPVMKKALADRRVKHTYKKSDSQFVLHLPGGDTIIHLLAAENYERLAGMTLAWAGLDEVDRIASKQLAIDAFGECVGRVTKGNVVQIFLTSTPEGFHFMHHFFVKDAVDEHGKPKPDREMIRVATKENPYVPASYRVRYMATHTAKQAEGQLEGKFVNLATGNVYYAYDRTVNATSRTLADFATDHVLHIGLDFNVGAMSAVVACIDKNVVYVVEEIVGAQNTDAMIHEIKMRYGKRKLFIYPDSAGKSSSANADISSIQKLKNAGFECCYSGNNPFIKDRVASVNAMFKNAVGNNRMFVNVAKCPKLVDGLEQQGYDLRTGKPDKTQGLDHCLDALGYFVHYRFPITGNPLVVKPI